MKLSKVKSYILITLVLCSFTVAGGGGSKQPPPANLNMERQQPVSNPILSWFTLFNFR